MYLIMGHCKLKIRESDVELAKYVLFLGMILKNIPKNKYDSFSDFLQKFRQFGS